MLLWILIAVFKFASRVAVPAIRSTEETLEIRHRDMKKNSSGWQCMKPKHPKKTQPRDPLLSSLHHFLSSTTPLFLFNQPIPYRSCTRCALNSSTVFSCINPVLVISVCQMPSWLP